ncbi:MAG: UDP-N-acetylmuramoyl-L-alanine--D-glutamate ligase [Lachnospiraceae bacterium]|nr:UDP-N-acetylmuramoyl-L-alanine--D-glutamate ligase [Lachnospiraceae bacterium]
MNLQNKQFLVVGMGKSGIAAAELLVMHQMKVVIFDENPDLNPKDVWEQSQKLGMVPVVVGKLPEEIKNQIDICIMSPGVPTDLPVIQQLKQRNVLIWGEIELAYRFSMGNLIGITGTNGKTTTTSLVGEIMQSHFESVKVVGNIGVPYTQMVSEMNEQTVTVAEISSFQLETIDSFHPNVSAVLNIQPDHLNRHHTMENYIGAKERIFENQTEADCCVLNYDDLVTRKMSEKTKAKVCFFSSKQELEEGFFVREDWICRKSNGTTEPYMNIHDMNLVGMCNVENVMAAMAISTFVGVPKEQIIETIRNFKAVEHRIEFVAQKKGVVYYNDSKATNPDAAIQGIRAMNRPTILIGGGYDKGNDFDDWIEAFDSKVKLLILIGATAEKIAQTAKKHGMNQYCLAKSFEEAMELAIQKAKEGDAVLLSPACASWGMFPNYEERGKLFKSIVNQIKE